MVTPAHPPRLARVVEAAAGVAEVEPFVDIRPARDRSRSGRDAGVLSIHADQVNLYRHPLEEADE